MTDYVIVVRPLTAEDGGGFMAYFPDLPGCMGDGDTEAAAIADAREAMGAWMEVQSERGVHIPQPGEAEAEVRAMLNRMNETIARQTEEIASLKAALAAKGKEPAKTRWRSLGETPVDMPIGAIMLSKQSAC
ncbi:type II toxin-antitoxin system HicB family antitoxin [Rubellimicrobium roseum]|uniref:Type II toxin-antitoxin system HicB family antitoxin n=1 Tax=Rubellimicrobium roseum TaxID=687525 RepID=A0A5C4NJT0_9RHOB|nr:type II toxin-antitoxin system HicB family antitoxin [Rubellimicrobium roseum]TNC74145.1 type II toxin-antitoxin system HicB family antitoxin [Rubellimicrobium roseum]